MPRSVHRTNSTSAAVTEPKELPRCLRRYHNGLTASTTAQAVPRGKRAPTDAPSELAPRPRLTVRHRPTSTKWSASPGPNASAWHEPTRMPSLPHALLPHAVQPPSVDHCPICSPRATSSGGSLPAPSASLLSRAALLRVRRERCRLRGRERGVMQGNASLFVRRKRAAIRARSADATAARELAALRDPRGPR